MKKNKKVNVQEEVRFDSFVSQAVEQGPDIEEEASGKKRKKKDKGESKSKARLISDFSHLNAVRPESGYVFKSDYFKADDDCYGCIMSFFHTEGAMDNFGPFWGVNKIPSGLGDDVIIVLFEQVRRMTDGWLSDHQSRSESIAKMNENEQDGKGNHSSRTKASRKSQDLLTISQELQDGASYLHVHYRLLVKAPTLEKLDSAVQVIDRCYVDRFSTLSAAPYIGEQRQEMSTLFLKNEKKEGKGFYFTSLEFAGSYSLVTHGLEDPRGEYVGYMVGDVNNSAVLFDVNGYSHHCVVADESYEEGLGRAHVSDVWGSKVSQACLLDNGRAIHLILDGANLNQLGPRFEKLTYRVDMNRGDVNMFEMFGDREDQMAIFPAQMQKLIVMAEQAYEANASDKSIIRGSLQEIATKFYIDNRMWYENAASWEDRIRIVGIPHKEVPKLEMFVSYLDMEYKAMANRAIRDDKKLQALSILRTTFKNMLSNNGDLFNTITSSVIDGAQSGRRVIYDFSRLMQRGLGIAMAQLVNVIGFAVGSLGRDDTVIIHGAELIDDGVKPYIRDRLSQLYDRGGRVCYLYNKMDRMLSDKAFCEYDKADYTIFGTMTDGFVSKYQESIGQSIPTDLIKLVTNRGDAVSYIRRGVDNVVFHRDLLLGLDRRVVR